ncbi:MAG: 50S ribosomal protein L21 [Deltaproteobacteria bacterium]|nr:50S ribosomal protein L21 [Deltaproteobacteria bacterium]
MYAVVNTGGKQYKVQQGEVLRVEKIPGDVGSPVTFDRVLMFSDGDNVSIGQPELDNVAVEGHIVEQGKAKKIIVFKYKKRKRYRRKQGHRQTFTAVQIDSITAKEAKAKETPQTADEPKPDEPELEAKTDEPELEAKTDEPELEAKTDEPELEAKTDEPELEAKTDEPELEAKTDEPELKAKAAATKKAVPKEKDKAE